MSSWGDDKSVHMAVARKTHHCSCEGFLANLTASSGAPILQAFLGASAVQRLLPTEPKIWCFLKLRSPILGELLQPPKSIQVYFRGSLFMEASHMASDVLGTLLLAHQVRSCGLKSVRSTLHSQLPVLPLN